MHLKRWRFVQSWVSRNFILFIVEVLKSSQRLWVGCEDKETHFHCLKVDEGVNGYSCSFVVRLVSFTAESCSVSGMNMWGLFKTKEAKGTHCHEVVRTVNQVYVIMVKAVIAAKSQPNLYVYPRLIRSSSHEMKMNTYQNTKNHRNLQCSRNDPENNSLQQKGDTSTSPLCRLIHNQHKNTYVLGTPINHPCQAPRLPG